MEHDADRKLPTADQLKEEFGGYWGEHPDHPSRIWRGEIADGNTRQGYWGWVQARSEMDPKDFR